MAIPIQLEAGERFGRLTVVHLSGLKWKYRTWECVCDCGKTAIVRAVDLKNGTVTSCGCHLGECRSALGNYRVEDEEVRFWMSVKSSKDGCWEWQKEMRGANGRKYGVFYPYRRSKAIASRYSWELHNGEIGDSSLFVCHKCDNPKCVRPDHLFLGTNSDNIQDAIRKGRFPRGKRMGRSD